MTDAACSHSSRIGLKLCVFASAALIILTATEWWLIDWVTVFVMPLLKLTVLAVLAACLLWAIGQAGTHGRKAAAPLLVCGSALLIWWFVPFTWWWININFHFHRAAREAIVARIERGQLKPNLTCCPFLIALGPDDPYVSMGGNELAVEDHDGRKYVMFYTFRGILDNYSGFLYVPHSGDPTRFGDLNEPNSRQLFQFAENWYWASHR